MSDDTWRVDYNKRAAAADAGGDTPDPAENRPVQFLDLVEDDEILDQVFLNGREATASLLDKAAAAVRAGFFG